MPLTDEQIKAAILSELGEAGNATLTTQLAYYWELYEEMAPIPRLRILYVTWNCALWLLGQDRKNAIDTESRDTSIKFSQRIKHLQDIRDSAKAEIERIEESGQVDHVPLVGRLTANVPADPTFYLPDPNHPRYRGDPVEY